MSMWTYVRGLIELVVPGRTQAEKDYILQTVIDHLPKVTGSEYGMNVYTIRANGHNHWSNRDELDHLKWDFKTQSKYFLVLDGSLRDRHYEDTLKEFNFDLSKCVNLTADGTSNDQGIDNGLVKQLTEDIES